ncbi:MAG: peptidoglycan-binding protein [Devosia sp.]|uniref:peptidoglycan-binding domain-containing protein n=1 Tax=Devosia sp. TaxID=1871048 RepID=UPI0024C8236F|nr:peptidoglycan-binding domain-containing protein [Devosia sp.]UYN99677.1 MAG: peptidoglycan-binding protein [Devosia sp.]
MTASTLTQLPLMAGGALLGSVSRAGLWAVARFMRAPLASTGLLAMVTLTALAGSNALYFQTSEHPSPFFMPSRDTIASMPTPAAQRPEPAPAAASLPAIAETVAQPQPAPVVETTGSVGPQVIPDRPVGNTEVFAVQKRLAELNLFQGTVDGYYGPKTAEAIRAFEQRNGLQPNGALNPSIVEAILSSDASGRMAAQAVQPQAVVQPAPQPVAQPVQVQIASTAVQPAPVVVQQPVAQPQQDVVVARLPALSPAEQALDQVAQSAANTLDSIVAAVDGSRTPPTQMANPPIPTANVAAATQPIPAPVPAAAPAAAEVAPVAAARTNPSQTAVMPATDTELVTRIQRGLASLGFFRAAIDGKPGPETARAIREFENFYSYRQTGQVKPDLVDLLVQAGATI